MAEEHEGRDELERVETASEREVEPLGRDHLEHESVPRVEVLGTRPVLRERQDPSPDHLPP